MGRPLRELATHAEAFAQRPLVFGAPPGREMLHHSSVVVVAELASEPFIAREHGSGTRGTMENFFAEHCVAPQITTQTSSNDTSKQAVRAAWA
jgi:DNA-binding transcriptional LysR family regulator